MKNNIKLLLKGFVIGLGKIIPGVSGAVIAIMLNIYEPALNAISNLKKNIYYNFKYLAILGSGMILAIVLGSKLIIFFLDNYYLQTIFLFLGMMISGTTTLFKEIRQCNWIDILLSLLPLSIFWFFSIADINIINLDKNIYIISIASYFVSGILDASCSIIPGISGTAILMMFGTYPLILKSFGSVLEISCFATNLIVLTPFVAGFIIGGYYISKLINYLFHNYRERTYFCITGFSILSMIGLAFPLLNQLFKIERFLTAIVCLAVGYLITNKMNI